MNNYFSKEYKETLKIYKKLHLNGTEFDSAENTFDGKSLKFFFKPIKQVIELTRNCSKAGKIVAGICHGPWVLISAGLTKGKNTCGYDAVHDDLINTGSNLLDVPTVRDGNIITGRVPDDLPEFCEEIINALSE